MNHSIHHSRRVTLFLVAVLVALGGCSRGQPDEHAHGAEHSHDTEAIERGPNGGRMLRDGDFALELAIYETGVPPEYRAWAWQAGRPLKPAEVSLHVQLTRLGGRVDAIAFAPEGDYLRGNQEIVEPHSFDVVVSASHAGREHKWSYESYEGRTTITAEAARAAGIETATAEPGTIAETVTLYGTIAPDVTRVREVRARYPGVIRSVSRQIGDTVRAGDPLATVESNESLQTYPVTAPIAGTITQRHAQPGEQTDEEALFQIVDFSRVNAELRVFPRDRARLRVGQRVRIRAEGSDPTDGTITHIAAIGNQEAQSLIARVVLDNAAGGWTAGQFVEGLVTVQETPVRLAVPLSALQTFRDFTVVYAQVGDQYEVRMLELGRRDGEHAEVLSGLEPGTRFVTRNSFLIKADIEKSGASHDH